MSTFSYLHSDFSVNGTAVQEQHNTSLSVSTEHWSIHYFLVFHSFFSGPWQVILWVYSGTRLTWLTLSLLIQTNLGFLVHSNPTAKRSCEILNFEIMTENERNPPNVHGLVFVNEFVVLESQEAWGESQRGETGCSSHCASKRDSPHSLTRPETSDQTRSDNRRSTPLSCVDTPCLPSAKWPSSDCCIIYELRRLH